MNPRFILSGVSSGNNLAGNIDGGLGNGDIVNYSAVTGDLEVNIGGGINTATGVEQYTGNYDPDNNGQSVTLSRGTSAFNNWAITGSNSGILSNGSRTITFSNFNILEGYAGVVDTSIPSGHFNDTFTIEAGASFNGTIKGGNSTNTFTQNDNNQVWVLNSTDAFAGSLGSSVTDINTNFENIQIINGSGSDTLQFSDGSNLNVTWEINAANIDSMVTREGDTRPHITFNRIGVIQGQGGIDIFNIRSVAQNQSLDLRGGNGNDTYNLSDAANPPAANIINFDGQGGDQDHLVAADRNNDWNIGNSNSLNTLIAFQGIEQITGNEEIDTFTFAENASINQINGGGGTNNELVIVSTASMPNNSAIWSITENNGGNVIRRDNNVDTIITNFSAIQNLTGGEGNDNFIIDAASVGRTTLPTIADIVGGGGENGLSISGSINTETQWNITRSNEGNISSVVTSFTDISNLTGSEGADNFIFTTLNSNITGTINGNSGGARIQDSLDIKALVNGVSVEFGENAVNPTNLHVTQIENIIATNTADPSGESINHLIATDNRDLDWTIDGINEGMITPSTGANSQNSMSFENFGNIVGSEGIDSFILDGNTADIRGTINGGNTPANAQDNVNISRQNNTEIDLVNNNYENIEHYIGNDRNSRIVAPSDRRNNWTFNNTNAGSLDLAANADTAETTFEGFANITGGDMGDVFHFNSGSLAGEILAGIGNDQLNIVLADNQTGATRVNFIGSRDPNDNPSELNTVDISQQTTAINRYQASYNPQSDGSASLIYSNNETSQRIEVSFSQVDAVNDNVNVDTFTINDIDDQQDTIKLLNNNIFAFNDFTSINLNGDKTNFIINGENSDTVSIGGIFSIDNRFEVQRSTVVMDTSSANTEQYIDAQVVSFIDNTLIGNDTNTVQLSTNQLQLASTSGNVYIDNTNIAGALDITGINLPSGNITISADSNINSSGDIITENALSLTSSDNIILGDTRHRISGPLSIEALGEAQLNTTGSLALASINTGRLTIDAQGNITSTEASNIDITDLATFTTVREDGSSADIMLNQGTASISSILINNVNNIELSTTSELTIDGINADGHVTLQTAGLTINNNLNGQEINLEANTGDIQFNAAVTAGAALNVSGENINQNQDGAIEANSDITFNATGDIRQSASLSSNDGDIALTSAQTIAMSDASQISTQTGSIALSADNNVAIATLNAELGNVIINTQRGSITDVNNDAININSQRFEAHAANGIGVGNSIEMVVDTVMADSQQNQIDLSNTQALNVEHIRTNGDITLRVDEGNIVLDNTPDIPFDTSIDDANTPGAIVNAGYNQGTVNITLGTGSLFALGSRDPSQPDIVARQGAIINFPPGEIGSSIRPLVVYIRDSLTFDGFRSWAPIFAFGARPEEFNNNSTIQLDIRQLLQSGGELLNEVETLVDVNPAVFTDVKNFTYESLSIRMPRDQVYDEELLKTYDDDSEEDNYY